MQNSTQKTKGIWALAVVLLLLTLGGVFALIDKPSTTVYENGAPTPTPFVEVPGTESWRVYKGDGFTFKYPEDFVKQVIGTSTVRLVVPVKTYFHTILANEAYLTVYLPQNECPQSEGERFSGTTTLSSLGKTVFSRVEWTGVGAGQLYRGVDYSSMYEGRCYLITLYTHSANGAGFYFNNKDQIERTDKQHAEDMAAFLLLANKIISTFQFTN